MRISLIVTVLLVGLNINAFGRSLSDREVIALTLLGEARGEGEIGMRAVGSVIANRASERHQSIRTVCLQPYQFSCWLGKGVAVKLLKSREGVIAGKLADAMLNKRLCDVTSGANHYCRFDCHPNWADPDLMVMRLGNHCFYRL